MLLHLKPGGGTTGIAIPVDGLVWMQRCLSRRDSVFSVTHWQCTELSVLTDRRICITKPVAAWKLVLFFHLGVWSHIIVSEWAGGNHAGAVEREAVKMRLLGITELGCLEVKFGYTYEALSGTASWKVPCLSWYRLLGKPNTLVIGLLASRRLTGRFAFPGMPGHPVYSLGSFVVSRKSGRTYPTTYAPMHCNWAERCLLLRHRRVNFIQASRISFWDQEIP